MSPLQFQKQLRFQDARRLMFSENLDAAEAGYRVGYEDASHFSREYKRRFGKPPMRDVERLRELAGASAARPQSESAPWARMRARSSNPIVWQKYKALRRQG